MQLPATRLQRLLLVGGLVVLLLVAGIVVVPHTVYDQFVWKYFWGPVQADAGTGSLVDCPDTVPDTPTADIACRNGVMAHSGYTLVNEIGYGLILIYLLLLLTTVLRRFDVGEERGFVLYFVPFVIGGGMLRVVEDVASTQASLIGFPLRYALISPLIYGSMFLIVFATLLLGLILARNHVISDYKQVVAGGGTVFAVLLAGFIALHADVVEGWMLPATVGGAAVILGGYTVLLRSLTSRYPKLDGVITAEGVSVLYGHLVDAVSTAVSLDVLGMVEKHPVPRALIAYTGTPYSFIAVKLAVITGVLYYMDDELRADDPLFFNLILLGVLAVGFGPGIRNMLRAVFGV